MNSHRDTIRNGEQRPRPARHGTLAIAVLLMVFTLACNLTQKVQNTVTVEELPSPTSVAPLNPSPGVTQTTPAVSPQPTPRSTSYSQSEGGMQIRFVNVSDGGDLPATLDAQGKPWVTARVEVSGGVCMDIQVQEDGVVVADAVNEDGAAPFKADLTWSPRRGGGEYTLYAGTGDANKTAWASTQITVNVTGTAAYAPTQPPPSQQEANSMMAQKYMELWKLDVPYPAVTRGTSPDPALFQWISAAYIGDTFYVIHRFDDGRLESWSRLLNQPTTDGYSPICRPAGKYRILVLFVDYGNTGITAETALGALQRGAADINARYAQFSDRYKLSVPILQFEVTGAYLASPPARGSLVPIDQVRSLTGYDPGQFDLLAEVDLDVDNPFGGESGGMAIYGCTGAGTQQVNLWANVSAAYDVENLPKTLLIHEVDHLMGWSHEWPCGDGSTPDVCNQEPPYLLFGWYDTDSDGMPEIVSTRPYGAKE